MVMIVWFILSLFGVCEFSWLAVAIDAVLVALLSVAGSSSNKGSALSGVVALGVAIFAVYKHFFALAVSGWWLLASPVLNLVAAIFPGGYTITNFLLSKYELMTIPKWGMIVGIVVDIIYFIVLIVVIVDSLSGKKKEKEKTTFIYK